MFVLVLFAHIVGVLILFAAFALEWVALGQPRRSPVLARATSWPEFTPLLPRLHRTAGLLLIVTGGYMSSELAAWRSGWVLVSLATLVILAIVGMVGGAGMRALGHRPGTEPRTGDLSRFQGLTWLAVSFRVRVAAMLGVVYLMTAKPDFAVSVIVVAIAAVVGAASTLPMRRAMGAAA